MENIKIHLSPASQKKLKNATKKNAYVVSMHINETELICATAKQANRLWSKGVEIDCQYKNVEWDGITDFVVPPNCFEFFCAHGITYKDVLASFIKENTYGLIKKPTDGVVVVAFSFPVHTLWDGAQPLLLSFLDACFVDCEWIIPIIVSGLEYYYRENKCAFVYVDKKWTTFVLGENKYSVAFGTHTDFHNFQINNYLNNSTKEWVQKSYPSWEDGFMDICEILAKGIKKAGQKLVGIADRKKQEVIEMSLFYYGLAISWDDPASIVMKFLIQNIGLLIKENIPEKSTESPKKKESSNISKNNADKKWSIKRKNDPFKF